MKQAIPKNESPFSFLAGNIKFLRQSLGLSQPALAKALGMKRNYIGAFESGLKEPKIQFFLKMADFFEVSPDDLVDKDFTNLPSINAFPFVENETKTEAGIIDSQELDYFLSQMADLQKVLDGFRQFYKLKNVKTDTEVESGSTQPRDYSDLLDVMEKFLEVNWRVLRSL